VIGHQKMEHKIQLKTLNPHIACSICNGYLIDATTVVECLHTFCKSCLVSHLEDNNTCPKCQIVIHQSHPLNYISYDRTMQDIIYKLVPNLQERELKREIEFYKKRGLPCPKLQNVNNNNNNNNNNSSTNNNQNQSKDIYNFNNDQAKEENSDYHRSDEQVNVSLETLSQAQFKQIKRRFIRCSSHATVTHLKKYVAKKLFKNFDRYKDIDILCNNELLGKDHTLKFVMITKWRYKEQPLQLAYRKKVDY